MAIGNGILDAEMDLTSLVYYTYHHGLIGNVYAKQVILYKILYLIPVD